MRISIRPAALHPFHTPLGVSSAILAGVPAPTRITRHAGSARSGAAYDTAEGGTVRAGQRRPPPRWDIRHQRQTRLAERSGRDRRPSDQLSAQSSRSATLRRRTRGKINKQPTHLALEPRTPGDRLGLREIGDGATALAVHGRRLQMCVDLGPTPPHTHRLASFRAGRVNAEVFDRDASSKTSTGDLGKGLRSVCQTPTSRHIAGARVAQGPPQPRLAIPRRHRARPSTSPTSRRRVHRGPRGGLRRRLLLARLSTALPSVRPEHRLVARQDPKHRCARRSYR